MVLQRKVESSIKNRLKKKKKNKKQFSLCLLINQLKLSLKIINGMNNKEHDFIFDPVIGNREMTQKVIQ